MCKHMNFVNDISNVKLMPVLYIVPTPIGNLEDITLRAISVLRCVDFVATENIKHTSILLQHFCIKASLIKFNMHNEEEQTLVLISKLKLGLSIALVSKAGTPVINDPGRYLVRYCLQNKIKVVPLPGACAAITALSASGLFSDRFCYDGFLPSKRGLRLERLHSLLEERRTLIFCESTHRLIDSVSDMLNVFGSNRYVVLARELTKFWESIYGSSLHKLFNWLLEDNIRCRGEIIVIVEGCFYEQKKLSLSVLNTMKLLMSELPVKRAIFLVSKIYGINKHDLYSYTIAHQ